MSGRQRVELVADYELSIYLPMSYSEGNKHYPVVYVQDEGEVVYAGLNYIDHLVITKQIPELIFVGIKPFDRNLDYTPWPARSLVPEFRDFGGGAKAYLQTLVSQIKKHIDTTYRTRSEPECTGIAGCSFGGLVSLIAYYEYPHIFGRVGLISTSFWYDQLIDFMRKEPISTLNHRIYMYVGELEGIYKKNIQRDMVTLTKEAHALLLSKGFPVDQLKFETDPNGTHDDFFFAQKFMHALKWMFNEGEVNDEH